MRWRDDFNPKVEVVDRVVAWVRFPDLPTTHFDSKFLFNVGNVIRKAIRVDLPTAQRGRGKFARLCVELDLTKPLIPHFSIEGRVQAIDYECMSLLCLHCGRYGHVREACGEFLRVQREKVSRTTGEKEKNSPVRIVGEEKEQEFDSPWKVVQRPWRARRSKPVENDNKNRNRFSALSGVRGGVSMSRPLKDVTNGLGNGGKMRKGAFKVLKEKK